MSQNKITPEAKERIAARLYGAGLMAIAFFVYVCVRSILDRHKVSNMPPHPVYCDGRAPLLSMLMDTKNSRFTFYRCLASIFRVLGAGYHSKIVYGVIGFISIHMVNCPGRPFSVNPKIRETMTVVRRPIYGYGNIPAIVFAARCFSDKLSVIYRQLFPSKYTCILVVIENFTQMVCGKIGLSHAVVPYKQWCGQKPRRVTSTSGLRYFIRQHTGRPL